MCGGYRKLNSITDPDQYSPPLIQDLFPRLSNKKRFSKVDMQIAYLQLMMDEKDIEKTAIINLSKCIFNQLEIKVLGYTINEYGYTPTSERVDAIVKYPKPKTISELRRFLGMINYYRRCTPQAAQLQLPLNSYLRQPIKSDKTKISWSTEAEKAYEAYKRELA